MAFNSQEHLTKIKTKQGMKDYLQVQWRLVWFREQNPQGTIETEMVHLDTEKKLAVFKAIAADGKGGLAMGHGSESEHDFADYIEKAETKSVGRALAMLGYGTQFTGDELDETPRIVDSPVIVHQDEKPDSPLATVKAEFLRLFKPAKWEALKVGVIGVGVIDSALDDKEIARLAEKLAEIRGEQKKAS